MIFLKALKASTYIFKAVKRNLSQAKVLQIETIFFEGAGMETALKNSVANLIWDI